MKTRGWNNYITFDLRGNLDIPRLQNACQQFLDCHAILRTVFIVSERTTLQVVLKDYPLIFETVNVDSAESVVSASEAFYKKDIAAPFSLGDPITKFTLLRKSDTIHRLIMRLSHAQYDAESVRPIRESFEIAYTGSLEKVPNFSHFVDIGKLNNTESYTFWKEQLNGSQVTQVFTNPIPNHGGDPTNDSVKISIDTPDLQNYSLISATAIAAAWALVLSTLSSSTDVVFASVSRGRFLDIPNIETLLGACVCILPVRLQIQSSDTVLTFLEKVQNYFLDTVPYEQLGFRKIIESCTDWQPGSRFSTLINVINWTGYNQKALLEEGLEYEIDQFEPLIGKADLYLVTKQYGTRLEVDLRFCNTTIARESVEELAKIFCETVQNMPSIMDKSISVLTDQLKCSKLKLPLEKIQSVGKERHIEKYQIGVQDGFESKVEQVWRQVLGDTVYESLDSAFDKSFFEAWPDPICASGLSEAYRQAGFEISVEEILENQSVEMQVQLLGSKCK